MGEGLKQALALLFAFLYLNVLFTFENIPSTPALTPVAKLSIELVALLGILALTGHLSRFFRGVLAVAVFLFTLIRYVDVTALGVLGREFNLHGDFPHLHRVFAMFWEAMSLSSGLLVLGVVTVLVGLVLALNWIALGLWARALEHRRFRRGVLVAVPVLVGLFLLSTARLFAVPTSAMVAKQIGNLRSGEAEQRAALEIEWPAQNVDSTLDGLDGANVFVIFLESYGVTLIEDAHHFEAIAPRYEEMAERLDAAGYSYASSQIQSPTFGGGSWRAHATFLSGFHVETEHLYNALLDSERKTLVSVLSERGYRTVAIEPGIKWFWPDGEFYGFDRIYAFDDIDSTLR